MKREALSKWQGAKLAIWMANVSVQKYGKYTWVMFLAGHDDASLT